VQGSTTVADVSRLPPPIVTAWEWQMDAACREIDNAVFFHPARERGAAKEERDSNAKKICFACPVIAACRRHALAVREPYGVWGGLTTAERETILHGPAGLP
jgi:WhiB family transcriptional regulator, redox-sensing transcriptional regulator